MPSQRAKTYHKTDLGSGLGARGSGYLPSPPRQSREAGRGTQSPQPRATIGCGIDVVELPRFRRAVSRGGTTFMRRVFTKGEEAYAKARPRTTLLHLAGRFAAKEAVIKAISQIDPRRLLAMNQVEIRNDTLGRPRVILHDRWATRITVHISLSHVDTVAVASAIAIK